MAAAAFLALAGCGGGSSGPPRPTDTSLPGPTATRAISTPPSPAPNLDPAQAALTAYRDLIDDWVTIAATSDYESTLPARHASGSALDLIYHAVFNNKRNNVVTKGRPLIHPSITAIDPSATPTRATVLDCVDTTHWLNYKPDGQLQDNIPGGLRRAQALVVNVGGTWKVSQLVIGEKGTCTVPS